MDRTRSTRTDKPLPTSDILSWFDQAEKVGSLSKLHIPADWDTCHCLDTLIHHRGIVLHGSPDGNIRRLEPRQPKVKTGSNSIRGVWASTDAAMVVFWATLTVSPAVHRCRHRNRQIRSPVKDRSQLANLWKHAYVYLLDGEPFRRIGNNTCVSLISADPITRLDVGPGDFPFADSVETRTSADENLGYFKVKEAVQDLTGASRIRTETPRYMTPLSFGSSIKPSAPDPPEEPTTIPALDSAKLRGFI